MKNRLLLYYFGVLILALCLFSACSDDDVLNESTETSGEYWDKLSGVYRGDMVLDINGTVVDTIYQQAKIVSDNRNQMTLHITSLVIDGMHWNNIFFKNVYFSENENSVDFTAETVQQLGEIVNVSLSLKGTIAGDDMVFSILVNSVTIQPTTLSFKGEKIKKEFNSESKILKITLDNDSVIRQPALFHISPDGVNIMMFYVPDTLDMDSTKILAYPKFELSEGATISFPDSLMDFAKGASYTVWAEDLIHFTTYKFIWSKAMIQKYDIGRWQMTSSGWEEPLKDWSTNNGTLQTLMTSGGYKGDYVVKRVKGMEVGDWAAEMKTVQTGEGDNQSIFAGSFFLGSFDLSMQAPLYGPLYGVPAMYAYTPSAVRGYYKYLPADDVYVGNTLFQDTVKVTDTCRICAIVYEIENPEDLLDTVDYMNDPKVVAIAEMERQAGIYQSEYIEFSIYFDFVKNYFVNKKYKIAFICSSSRDADKKRGAPGSVLTVGGVEVMYQRP